MKLWIAALGLIIGMNAHAMIFLTCTEDPDQAWIDTSVRNWKSHSVQDGIELKTVAEARARAKDALANDLDTLDHDGDVSGVVIDPDVVAIIYPAKPHTPAACAILSGQPIQAP